MRFLFPRENKALEEVKTIKHTKSEVASPELQRSLIQFAVVHKANTQTNRHKGEKYQQHATIITPTSKYVFFFFDCVILTLLLVGKQ